MRVHMYVYTWGEPQLQYHATDLFVHEPFHHPCSCPMIIYTHSVAGLPIDRQALTKTHVHTHKCMHMYMHI